MPPWVKEGKTHLLFSSYTPRKTTIPDSECDVAARQGSIPTAESKRGFFHTTPWAVIKSLVETWEFRVGGNSKAPLIQRLLPDGTTEYVPMDEPEE